MKLFIEQLFEEAFLLAAVVFAKRVAECLQKLFLLRVKVLRGFNRDGYDRVALALGVYVGNTLSFHSEGGSGLRTLRNFELIGSAAEGGNVDLCAKSRLNEGNRYLALDVIAVTLEDLILLNPDLDDKVAVRSAVKTC